jgi:general secretion pathway protein C
MTARWFAFVIWGAAAATAVFWGFRLFVPSLPAPAHALTVSTALAARGDMTRLLGNDLQPVATAEAPLPATDTRFQLVGVVSPRAERAAGEGLALIAVDGKPAKAYRVGSTVEGETVLHGVSARGAALGPRGQAATVALEIAPLPLPATGSMPAAVQGDEAAAQGQAPAQAPVRAFPRPLVRPAPGAAAAVPFPGMAPGQRSRADPDAEVPITPAQAQ